MQHGTPHPVVGEEVSKSPGQTNSPPGDVSVRGYRNWLARLVNAIQALAGGKSVMAGETRP
jgi:hypothetical protein